MAGITPRARAALEGGRRCGAVRCGNAVAQGCLVKPVDAFAALARGLRPLGLVQSEGCLIVYAHMWCAKCSPGMLKTPSPGALKIPVVQFHPNP
jgi:hypothetical protein